MAKMGFYGKLRTGLLLALAAAGAMGAWCSLLTVGADFWLMCIGMGVAGAASCLVWAGHRPAAQAVGSVLYLGVCAGLGLANPKKVIQGGSLALQLMVERINVRQEINLVLPDAAGAGTGEITFVLLLFLAPQILLLCYAVLHRKAWVAGLVYSLPVLVSSISQSFLDMETVAGIVFVMGMIGISAHFKDDREAEGQVLLAGQLVLGAVMLMAYLLILPIFDVLYGNITGIRMDLTFLVNERILPEIKSAWSLGGILRSGTVEGDLSGERGFAYTQTEFFEVTVDECPHTTVYLRGFVGDAYTGSAWEAEDPERLGQYYQTHGFRQPEDYAVLVNDAFEILQNCQTDAAEPYTMTIRELWGDNVYSLYPYGAWLPENGGVYADGSLDKQGEVCSYEYYPLYTYQEGGLEGTGGLEPGQLQERMQYRQYVYDNYLDYPEELLPEFTAWVEDMAPMGDSVWQTAYNVVDLLERTAVYDLKAQACPPERDFVEYFLFGQKKGYCAHFASAAVLMFRSQGIPARYATGYCASPGEFVADGDGNYTAVIKDRQAHAWAEIYLDSLGWVPIEATPADVAFLQDNRLEMLQQIEAAAGGARLDDGEDVPEEEEDDYEYEIEDDEEEEDDELQQDSIGDEELEEDGRGMDWKELVWRVTGVLLAAMAMLWAASAVYRRRQRIIYQRLLPAGKVCNQYRRLVHTMLQSGADREGMEERGWFAEELGRLQAETGTGEVDKFLNGVDKCTFGEGQPDEETLHRAEEWGRRIRMSLYGHQPIWKRYFMIYLQEWDAPGPSDPNGHDSGKWEKHADNRVKQGKL